jgi:hypothetical protein
MNTIRPSIMLRPCKVQSRSGLETADDAWIQEEKRLEARRQRVAGYETQFRVTHTYDATREERRDRVDSLQAAHDMLMRTREQARDRQRKSDRDWSESLSRVAAQQEAEDRARANARRQAEVEASRANQAIAEARRAARSVGKQKENAFDNEMIRQTLSARRTFLY